MATSVALILLYLVLAAGYLAVALVLGSHGVAPAWLALGAVVTCSLPPFAVATTSFVLAWIFRTPRPPERTIGIAASVRMFVGEVMAIARSHPRMAIGWWAMRDPPPVPSGSAVLLLHGVLCNAGMWRGTIRRLVAAGCGPVYALTYGPPRASIELFAEQVAAKVDAIRTATGVPQVALVGHSLGGVVARAYLRRFGSERIRCLVTIGSPHHGSVHAWLFPAACLAQIRPGNEWLAALDATRVAPPTRVVSLWSWHDSMVAPQASAQLAGAENVPFVGIGHVALVDHPDIVARVITELSRA